MSVDLIRVPFAPGLLSSIVEARTAQFMHVAGVAQRVRRRAPPSDESYHPWGLFNEAISEYNAAIIVAQCPEMLDSLHPLQTSTGLLGQTVSINEAVHLQVRVFYSILGALTEIDKRGKPTIDQVSSSHRHTTIDHLLSSHRDTNKQLHIKTTTELGENDLYKSSCILYCGHPDTTGTPGTTGTTASRANEAYVDFSFIGRAAREAAEEIVRRLLQNAADRLARWGDWPPLPD